jgi:hypothetical protein
MNELIAQIDELPAFISWYQRNRFLTLCRYTRKFVFNNLQKTRYSDLVIKFKQKTLYNDIPELEHEAKEEPLITFSEQN